MQAFKLSPSPSFPHAAQTSVSFPSFAVLLLSIFSEDNSSERCALLVDGSMMYKFSRAESTQSVDCFELGYVGLKNDAAQ